MITWFHAHPASEAASRVQSERHFVALAFEQLRQAVFQGQVTCETLCGVLVYLRVSLNGAILETLRVSRRPEALSERIAGGRDLEGHLESHEVWQWFQARLSSERERRLAYLLYHCGLQSSEIVRGSPQEWSDVHEVARLRRVILEHFSARVQLEIPQVCACFHRCEQEALPRKEKKPLS